MITEDLIVNFFEGKCDAREVAIVQAWLNENPVEAKKYIGEEEWENFQHTHVLSTEISGKLWNNIEKTPASPAARYNYLRWMAVAASLLLAVGMSWQFMIKRPTSGLTATATTAKATNISNSTPQNKMLALSDGSTVELSPNSTASYPENFTAPAREVVVKGEAVFDIAKDAAKPFFVYINSIKITVLGTRFAVNSYDSNKTTKVILQEGRIMVNISDSSSLDNKKEYYLTPGDIFIYKKSTPRILHLEEDKDHGYVFNNYPLDVVFDQLQIIYNTKIVYNRAELGNRTFIGKIDRKDALSHILKSITLLNKFSLRQQGDSLIISN